MDQWEMLKETVHDRNKPVSDVQKYIFQSVKNRFPHVAASPQVVFFIFSVLLFFIINKEQLLQYSIIFVFYEFFLKEYSAFFCVFFTVKPGTAGSLCRQR